MYYDRSFVYAGTAAKEGAMNHDCAVGYASEADINAWMELAALVRDAFPGLSLGEYRENLLKAIAERRALCAKDAGGLLGVLILSEQCDGIGFLAVLFSFAVTFFPPSQLPVGSPAIYTTLVVCGTALFLAVPIVISIAMDRRRGRGPRT